MKNKAKVGADLVVADPALSHQLAKVFRMKTGDSVILFDGDGFEYISTVASLRKDGAVFHIEKVLRRYRFQRFLSICIRHS